MDKAPMSMAPPAPESPAAAGHKFDGLTQDLKQDLKQDLARLIIAAMAERLGAAEARQREAQAWAAREQAARIAIETSTVWRMTAPLRALMSRVPGRLRHWRLSGHITAHTTPHRRQARVAAPIALPCAAAPEVSVVIPAHGEPDLVRACLAAIAAHPPLAAFEVILVDDASADPGIEALAGIEGLRFLRAPRNLGYLKACNWAAEAARGQFLMLLNSDTEVRAGWLDALLAALRETPDAAAAGARLIYPDGRLQEAGCILWNDGSGWNYGNGQDPDSSEFRYRRDADWCSAAALLVRTADWRHLSGFDPFFIPAYSEDADLALRLRARGRRTLYVPESVVIHHEGGTYKPEIAAAVKARNAARLRYRWGDALRETYYTPSTSVLRARDHALHRRVTLVIDHMVPEPDRDAGSTTIAAFIDGLRAEGDVVKFWPCDQYRRPGYTEALERKGVEVLAGKPGLGAWLRENGSQLDRVLIGRPAVAAELMPELRVGTAARLVYYGHDLHHRRKQAEAAVTGADAALREAEMVWEQERLAWTLADTVAYPSEAEAAEVRRLMPGTDCRVLLPYAFDNDLTAEERDPGRIAASVLMVAGFGHAPNEDAAMWFAREVWPAVWRAVPEARLILAGARPTAPVRALAAGAASGAPAGSIEVAADLSTTALAALYRATRAAVVPLRFGAGVKRKTLEACAFGVPLVTTSVGLQGLEALAPAVPVHDDAPGFAAALTRLLREHAPWVSQARAQRHFVGTHYSPEAMRRSLRAIFA